MADQHEVRGSDPDRALSFGSVAQSYERGRPGYPAEAVAWLLGGDPDADLKVLDLGAGTGKLTASLLETGSDVFAVEPDEGMLNVLAERLPEVRATLGSAEEIPVADAQFDVVVVAQAFHWFDQERALPEIARVLKSGGHLALVWNRPDTRVPWVRRLMSILHEPDAGDKTPSSLATMDSPLFGEYVEETFKQRQMIDARTVLDFAGSRSYVNTLPEAARAAKLAEVSDFYADYGRGMDGMQMPYLTHCFRVPVVARPTWAPVPTSEAAPSESNMDDTAIRARHDDSSMLLINFT
jgi:ubiquinone/menaquinone biosynthesis C-methylase UbiE